MSSKILRVPIEWDVRLVCLYPKNRLALFKKLDERSVSFFDDGILEEAHELLLSGELRPDSSAGRAIGYRQVIEDMMYYRT